MAIFLFALLVPTITSFELGPLRLTFYRLFLLVMFVPAIVTVFSGRRGGILLSDWFVLLFATWPVLSIAKRHGMDMALESGGIHILEGLGSYLIARQFIRDEKSFLGAVALLTAIVLGLSVFTIPEAVTGKHLLRAAFGGSLTGGLERRLGLDRAFGPFDHPILYGVFCASAISLSWYSLSVNDQLSKKRVFRLAGTMISTVMSVSSGALAAMICQLIPMGYERLTRSLRRRWQLMALFLAAMWVAVDFLSNRSPMRVFLTYLTFSATTAYNRLIIWQYGQHDVWNNPLFGIGFSVWSKPGWMHSNSMDNFWLVIPVRFGIPAFIGIAGAVIFTLIRLGWQQTGRFELDRHRKGWIFSMVGLIIAGTTVHFWNSLFAYFCFFVGAAGWMLPPKAIGANERAKRGI